MMQGEAYKAGTSFPFCLLASHAKGHAAWIIYVSPLEFLMLHWLDLAMPARPGEGSRCILTR